MGEVFTNGLGDRSSIPGEVIPKKKKKKKKKKALDATSSHIKHYKVRTKGKVEQSREWSSALPYNSV